jgi:hypothetical protein
LLSWGGINGVLASLIATFDAELFRATTVPAILLTLPRKSATNSDAGR